VAIDLDDLADGTTSWGSPLRGHLEELDTQGTDAAAAAAAAQGTADDAAAAAAAAQGTADDAAAAAAAAQAVADAAATVVSVDVTASGRFLASTTPLPEGCQAGDFVFVVPVP
jgi:prephenate dehydrogenase